MAKTKKAKGEHYVDNKVFLQAMTEWKVLCKIAEEEQKDLPKEEKVKPQVTNYIGECFLKIATHLSYRPNFINYTYRDEMIADGIENCLQYCSNFDPEKSKNPFAYFTQIIYYAFLRRIAKEKKQTHVKNKMIRIYGDKIGYLMSEKSFNNFQLTVEFRWNTDSTFSRKSNKKNSGIMYLIPPETPDELWPKGIQFQVKDGATGDFVLLQNVTLNVNGKQTEAGKSVTSARFADAEKPFGEWNIAVITSLNGKIKQELNGKLVNEGIQNEISEGRVLLQYEGYPIDFRKIIIKEL